MKIESCQAQSANIDFHEKTFVKIYIDTLQNIIPSCVFGVDEVSYVLYTREYRTGVKIQGNLTDRSFRNYSSVVCLVHGFTSEANNSNYFMLAETWLTQADVLIVSLDWSDAACSDGLSITDVLSYASAIKNCRPVGEYLAEFIVALSHKLNTAIEKVLIVGHSLGAHVAGFAAKALQDKQNVTLDQVIGLDPAGPLFMNLSCTDRLCKTDAKFVQIFHTSLLLGLSEPIGDCDYYFHGGALQPGCFTPSCSHSRVITYMTICIVTPCFVGTLWDYGTSNIVSLENCNEDNCSRPGLTAVKNPARGSFYVRVNSTYPYCTPNASSVNIV